MYTTEEKILNQRSKFKYIKNNRDCRFFAGELPIPKDCPNPNKKDREEVLKDIFNLIKSRFKNNKNEKNEKKLRNLVIINLLYYTGLRSELLLDLKVSNIQTLNNKVIIKINDCEYVEINNVIKKNIKTYHSKIGGNYDHIILSLPGNHQNKDKQRSRITREALNDIISEWRKLIAKSLEKKYNTNGYKLSAIDFRDATKLKKFSNIDRNLFFNYNNRVA